MQRKPWRHSNRQRQTIGTNIMTLEQTVKDVQASLANGNHADNAAVETNSVLDSLRNENVLLQHQLDDLKLKLEAALEQGAMNALKAMRLVTVEAQRDALQQQLEALTATQPVTVAATAKLECSIQYDVKAPEMARWRNDGWQIAHYQFVSNGTSSVPALAVVMERPAEIKPELFRRDEESIRPEAPAPLNFADTQKVEIVFADELDEIVIEEEPVTVPEFVPSMDVPGITIENPEQSRNTDALLTKLAQDKPIFAAILEHGADAVIDAMDAQVYDVGRAAYEAALPKDVPPWRFESKLLTALTPDPSPKERGEFVTELEIEIEAVLS
jgi:hypothetical protein